MLLSERLLLELVVCVLATLTRSSAVREPDRTRVLLAAPCDVLTQSRVENAILARGLRSIGYHERQKLECEIRRRHRCELGVGVIGWRNLDNVCADNVETGKATDDALDFAGSPAS